ncbi:YicC/YloC family endoribonuclease [Ampullimonas aquatilis]|uniref:YicC/YloC family endoribonuclease n=1 Tax=Ampullimonas aquatilis TaxID=1341549 RepID=UPI003C7955AE
MIFSMTGYANQSITTKSTAENPEQLTVNVELKSVNSRYQDLVFKIPDELRQMEATFKEAICKTISRGKIECRISLLTQNQVTQNLNQTVLQNLVELQKTILTTHRQAMPLSVAEILRWPGVLTETNITSETLQETILHCLQDCLKQFVTSRSNEGTRLKEIIFKALSEMEIVVTGLTGMTPMLIEKHQQKLLERLNLALEQATAPGNNVVSKDEIHDRIRQEVVLYGIRIDVAEELNRLVAHIAETRSILEKGGNVGKRLDFMMQELNREANTLGSKAAAKELADASMTLKLLIEQIREQVQNLE